MATQYVAPVNGTWAAKSSSPFGAGRSGGRRLHAGNDLQASNGSPVVASIGGTVLYAGHNSGYQWNAVIAGDDGNAFRYATHGPLSVEVGQRVEQGQPVGEIARGHLHFEVIPSTSPVYQEMVNNPGTFVGTQYWPGGKPVTVDPASFFGVERGAKIAAGNPVGSGGGTLVAETPDDPFGVAEFQREQAETARDAQGAIASLIAPSGGPAVPDQPTAAMGYAPNIPLDASFAPPMPPIQTAAAQPPLPAAPPSWASVGGFPIDESLTGASAQDVLAGGPRMDPRRAGPATGPIAPDMGSMRSPADVLNAGPNLRPTGPGIAQRNAMSGAPDAATVPNPLSRLASGVTPPPPQSVAMPNPPMRPGGAPDAGMVPTPPSRASGLPDPRMRPDINDPSLSFNAPPYAGGGPTAGPVPSPMQSMVASRPEFPGALPSAPPQPQAPSPPITQETMDSLGLAQDLNADRIWQEWQTDVLRPQASPPPAPFGRAPEVGNLNYSGPMPNTLQPQTQAAVIEPGMGLGPYGMSQPPSPFTSMVAGRPGFPGGGMPAAQGPFFDNANPGPTFSLPPPAGTSFNIPKSPFEGSTGEFFTPGPPMPSAPPAVSQGMRDQFNVAFSPGAGGGQIMDLQSAFNRQNAPPTMTAQDGINSMFGAPPAAAQPPNLAIPFAEVPGFDFSGRFNGEMPPAAAPAPSSSLFGPAPASAATVASPLPSPVMPSSITQADFDARFGGGSVVRPPTPPPAASPDVYSRYTEQGRTSVPSPDPIELAIAPPSQAPRNIGPAAEREKRGLLGAILGGLFPGAGVGGGIFGGFNQGPAFSPFSGGPMINTGMGSFRSSGTAPNASGGTTNFQHGTAFNGSSPATTFTTSDGRTYTYSSDPITGASIGGFV